jgi:hygromycin-B 4-O-kinase
VAKKSISTKKLGEAKRMVRRIIAHYLGQDRSGKAAKGKPAQIEPLAGGLTNLVFSVHDTRGDFIVRLGADAGKISAFMKEQWAMAKARELGVPTPEVLQVGNEAAPVPYMISRHSKGTEATFHPERLHIVKQMGHYAAVINSIPTDGFGSTFEWSHNQLSHNATWSEFLQNELKMDEKLETLATCGMLGPARIKRLRAKLQGAAGKGRVPALNHGDLRLKNVLVDDKGAISCILDWEHCTSNLAPEWELSIALHDLSIDEKQELLDGYGLNGEQISAISPAWKAMTLINYAPAVQLAAKSKNTAELERYRIRFAGELDLYSL